MVKHTQTIRRLLAVTDDLFECVWPFCVAGDKRLCMKGLIGISCKSGRGNERKEAVVVKIMEQFQNEIEKHCL